MITIKLNASFINGNGVQTPVVLTARFKNDSNKNVSIEKVLISMRKMLFFKKKIQMVDMRSVKSIIYYLQPKQKKKLLQMFFLCLKKNI